MAITPTDFEKIWSSNAITPAYTFDDADYLEGWDFVGNLPPTRAQWNAIQKRTDEKMKYVFDNFGAPLMASTVAEMTLQNRVYVYTGSEVGYTAGHWYYYDTGTSAWVDGGVYNAVAFTTDKTLTISGEPADAKVVGDRILTAIQPSVNLFDKNNITDYSGYPFNNVLTANANARTVYIPCKASTTYTVSKTLSERFAVAYTEVLPNTGVSVYGMIIHANYTSITITTSATANYLIVFLYTSSADTKTYAEICDSLQIEEGATATPYQPFVFTAIDLFARNSIETLDIFGDKNVLSANADLNSIEDSVWVAPTTAIAQTILHSPSAVPFKVISFKLYNTMQVQFLVDVADKFYYRTENSQGAFTDWRLCSDLLPLLTLSSTTKIATYGTELAPALADLVGTGTATFDTDRWTFTEGGELSTTITVEADATYLISLSAENVAIVNGDISLVPITISLGNKNISIYAGGDANWNVALTPTTSGSVQLIISALSSWAGDITNLSVKKITNNATSPLNMNSLPINVYNSNISFGGQGKILYNTARTDSNIGGRQNTSFGWNTQRDIDTGKWNSAFGFNAQQRMTQGIGNSAYGNQSQYYITTGCYNNAFGEASQGYMTTGMWNDAHGIEAQCYTATGKNNVAMGRRSQHLLTSGDFNTAIGAWAGFNSHDQSPEGVNSVRTSNYTTLIGGASTLKGPDTGNSDYATALGYQTKANKQGLSLGALSSADENAIAIGYGVNANSNTIVVGSNQNDVVIAGKRLVFNNNGTVTWTSV